MLKKLWELIFPSRASTQTWMVLTFALFVGSAVVVVGLYVVLVMRGETERHRPFALSEIFGEVILMDDQWKIVVNSSGQPYMLFNRHKDPEEIHNLAGRPEAEEIARSLRLRMLEHLVQTQRHSP